MNENLIKLLEEAIKELKENHCNKIKSISDWCGESCIFNKIIFYCDENKLEHIYCFKYLLELILSEILFRNELK